MKRTAGQAFWIARFDMEPLIGRILRSGMWMSCGLIVASLVAQWAGKNQEGFGPNLMAKSVPLLISADLQRSDSSILWPSLLVHLGVAVLLLTPYARVLATLLYFMWVELSWKRILFTSLVLALLTVILLSDWI